jgi:hypothetical protein
MMTKSGAAVKKTEKMGGWEGPKNTQYKSPHKFPNKIYRWKKDRKGMGVEQHWRRKEFSADTEAVEEKQIESWGERGKGGNFMRQKLNGQQNET